MSKLDRKPRAEASKKGMSVFDMSHSFKFTAVCGHILPIETDVLLPGDKVKIKADFAAKNLQPFLAPAMTSIDFHVDYFFVPFFMLYSASDNILSMTKENYSTSFNGLTKFPLLSKIEFYNNIVPNVSDTTYSLEMFGQGNVRLFDMLGYPTSEYDYFPSFFPYALLAYQCVYQHYFRNDEYERFDPSAYNCDNITNFNVTGTSKVHLPKLTIRYCDYYKDYFTSIKRSPLFNDLNSLLSPGNTLSQSLAGELDFILGKFNPRPTGSLVSNGEDEPVYNIDSFPSRLFTDLPTSIFSENIVTDLGDDNTDNTHYTNFARTTAQQRYLFAFEKLLMLSDRAKKNYDSQILARFGFNVPHDVKHEITHIGHYFNSMNIGELVAMSTGTGTNSDGSTYTTPFGDYGGKGSVFSDKQKPFNFTAPCHGVLIAVMHIVPKLDYRAPLLKRNFVYDVSSFYQPEFDGLGMQPLHAYEIRHFYPKGAFTQWGANKALGNVVEMTSETGSYEKVDIDGEQLYNYVDMRSYAPYAIQGWQYRYEEFKRGINRTSFAFTNNNLLNWNLSVNPLNNGLRGMAFGANGTEYADIVTNVGQFTSGVTFDKRFKCSPTVLNQLFGLNYRTDFTYQDYAVTPHVIYSTDQFIISTYIDYQKISKMSTYSMPNL